LRAERRVGEAYRENDIRIIQAWTLRNGRVVDMIAPARGEHGKIGRHLRRLWLQEQVIVLAEIGETLHVTGTEANEGFTRLEFQIDLVAHEAAQPVDLLAFISSRANAAIYDSPYGNNLGERL